MTQTTGTARAMTPGEWLMLLTLSLIWGGSFFFNEIAVRELPTFTVVVARVVLAAAILHLVLIARGQRLPLTAAVWLAFFGMGLLNNAVPFSLLVWGQTHITSGLASILNAMTPLFTVLVAHIATSDEKLNAGRVLGVVVALSGVAVMIGADALVGLADDVLAQLACVGAAVSYACAGIFGRRFRRLGLTPLATSTGQVTASSLLMLPLVLLIDQPWTLPMPSLAAIGALLGVGILCTAIAYLLYFRILSSAGATSISLVTFLVPVSAILLGVVFLGEVLEVKHVLGMAAIGFGLAAIDGRPDAALRRRWTTAA